jgi:hypothetical protein
MRITTLAALCVLSCIGLSRAGWLAADDGAKDGFVKLFNGKDLTGWKQINGTAKYDVVDGTIRGVTAEGSPNSFLCTEKEYGDFELRFEVLVDDPLNSGVQIRSLSKPDYDRGRVHGYQVEISTDGCAGLIYDEARRGKWLNSDEEVAKAKESKAFKNGEWNSYRVICQGDRIQTWVNGIQISDVRDSMTAKGFIGLQVHSYAGEKPAKVQWRNIEIKELP